jgi:hypothetical protein
MSDNDSISDNDSSSDNNSSSSSSSRKSRGLEATLGDTEQQLRRAAQMCRKQQGGAGCMVIDAAAILVAGARGMATDAALQGTGDAASTASTSSSKKAAEATHVAPLAEVTEASEEDVDDDD